jgi:metal-responsive CopG/Arc/MetJ family transcriptional regulator
MKTRLTLTIDKSLLKKIKQYAASKQISVSELVEEYFRSLLTKPKSRKSIIDLIEELPPHSIPSNQDLKKEFYNQGHPSLI